MKILYLIDFKNEKIYFIEDYDKYTIEQINQINYLSHFAVKSEELSFNELHLKAINQIENILIKDLALLNELIELEDNKVKIIKQEEFEEFKIKMKNFLIEEWEFEEVNFG